MDRDAIPMPRTIANRPRDERGYPIPAVTPWQDGKPDFGGLGSFRVAICLVERRCSVCGTQMTGPIYQVHDGDWADLMEVSLASGKPVINTAPSLEAPGHRSCMLYSVMVCPYISSPNARRQESSERWPKGTPRGELSGIVGYQNCNGFEIVKGGFRLDYVSPPIEVLRYDNGIELLDELIAEIARESGDVESCPDYLQKDNDYAQRVAKRLLLAKGQARRTQPAAQPSNTKVIRSQPQRKRPRAQRLSHRQQKSQPSTAAAIQALTRTIAASRASLVRWWYQRERAWWRRRQFSQCVALPGGGG
jgi:hypothetical protein